MSYLINLNKFSSTNQGTVSDIITYKIEVFNNSNISVEDLVIKDILHTDLKFILGSIRVDYISNKDANILSGVHIGDLRPDESKTITFDAQILEKSSSMIQTQSLAEYKYKHTNTYQNEICYSNICKIDVKNPSLKLRKEVDKQKAELGDILNYTLTLTNTGDLNLENLYLIENISNSVKIIDGSFSINGNKLNSVEIHKGVMLDCLSCGETMMVKYSVSIQSGGSKHKLCNESVVRYAYILPNGICKYKESNKVSVCVDMLISSFKQIVLEEYLTIPVQKPDIESINDVKANIKINKCNVVKTPVAISSEGQRLSGYKLVVHGTLHQTIEYVAKEPTQSLHSERYSTPFSNYIVLPSDFRLGSRVNVEGIIEDIYYNVINNRLFFKNVTMLLVAKVSLTS